VQTAFTKAGMRAEAILQQMEERYKMGNEDAKPNTTIYSSAITAWANIQDSNAGMRAEALLKRMDEPYRMGNKGVKPNTLSHSSAINVWAKKQSLKRCNASRSHSSANGRTILKLGNAYVELNTVSCSSVISARATSQHPNAALFHDRLTYLRQVLDKDVLLLVAVLVSCAREMMQQPLLLLRRWLCWKSRL
jgi:hypothetical protein